MLSGFLSGPVVCGLQMTNKWVFIYLVYWSDDRTKHGTDEHQHQVQVLKKCNYYAWKLNIKLSLNRLDLTH